jgi:hypothetical protein
VVSFFSLRAHARETIAQHKIGMGGVRCWDEPSGRSTNLMMQKHSATAG